MSASEKNPETEERELYPRESAPVMVPDAPRRSRVDVFGEDVATETLTPASFAEGLAKRRAQLTSLSDEEDVLAVFLPWFSQLAPGHQLALRLASPEGGWVDLVRSTAALLTERELTLRISEDALRRASIPVGAAVAAGFRVTTEYESNFQPDAGGFDIALRIDGSLAGVISFERSDGTAPEPSELLAFAAPLLGAELGAARARARSQHLQAYLDRVILDSNIPLVVLDPARRVQIVSRALLRRTECLEHGLLGADWIDTVCERDRRLFRTALDSALRGEPQQQIGADLHAMSGGLVNFTFDLYPVRSPQGLVEGVLAVGRDQSELRELEQQVVQAEKLATLGQLAAGVVHELNNPLTSISAYAEYLHRKSSSSDADPGDTEKLRRILVSVDRILRFSRDLVTYARPTTEAAASLDIHDVIQQSIVFCAHLTDEAGTEIRCDFGDTIPLLEGVRGQLHQVFINLITNACHAMPDGAGILTIRTQTEGRELTVSIQDNGSGIPSDQIQSIFEPFFSTKGEGKGTGLGLSIVRKIVQQHGGEIHAESIIGEGTTFSLHFPF